MCRIYQNHTCYILFLCVLRFGHGSDTFGLLFQFCLGSGIFGLFFKFCLAIDILEVFINDVTRILHIFTPSPHFPPQPPHHKSSQIELWHIWPALLMLVTYIACSLNLARAVAYLACYLNLARALAYLTYSLKIVM